MPVKVHPPGSPTLPGRSPAARAAQDEAPAQRPATTGKPLRYVQDETGRTIGWRRLSALEDFDLTEIAGANSSNFEWMIRATIAFGVREIDGEHVPRPSNKNLLRALVARLDDAGMAAIMSMFANDTEAQIEDFDKERAKNSAGTPE